MTITLGENGSANQLRADLASTASTALGDALVGVKSALTGAAATTQHIKNANTVSVWDFMTAAQWATWNAAQATTDVTAYIGAAIASFPSQGSPNWKAWTLYFPAGTYIVSSTINFKNQQGSTIMGYGAFLDGNFNGTVLQIGDTSGTNDVLWANIIGLSVIQRNTGASANAVVMENCYGVTLRDAYLFGGQYTLRLLGNANLISKCTMRKGITANCITAYGGNNEVNLFEECAFELSDGYGVAIGVAGGDGGHAEFLNCYFERNTLAGVWSRNSNMFRVAGCYFNIDALVGILLDGSLGPIYPDGYGVVENNRIASSAGAVFIKEASATANNCSYKNNRVESGSVCDLYGLAPQSINLTRRGDKVYVTNSDSFTGGPPPTGWTVVTGPSSTIASISPYGAGASLDLFDGYAWQNVGAPTNALLRISVWAKVAVSGEAALRIHAASLAYGPIKSASNTTTTPTRLELYLSPADRAGAATFAVMFRNVAGSNSIFSNIVIEDMTN